MVTGPISPIRETQTHAVTSSLWIDADLTLEIDGAVLHVTGEQGDLVVKTTRWLPVLRSLRKIGGPRLPLRSITAKLAEAGATVQLVSSAGPLLSLGAKAHPSFLGRVFGLRHLKSASPLVLWRHSRSMKAVGIVLVLVVALIIEQLIAQA